MLTANNNRFYACVTRFNNTTYLENERFRKNVDFDGCVYGSPAEMPAHIPNKSRIFVFEMNNDTNQIMGIGYLYKHLNYSRRHKIYNINDYNRYCYIGKYRVDRNEIPDTYTEFLKLIETNIFKGKNHQKRGHGFNCISDVNMKNIDKKLLSWLIEVFQDKYQF
jgi:hypothetical protein